MAKDNSLIDMIIDDVYYWTRRKNMKGKHSDYDDKEAWFNYISTYMNQAIIDPCLFQTVVKTKDERYLAVRNYDGFGWIRESRSDERLARSN